jgi:hypothetical protein
VVGEIGEGGECEEGGGGFCAACAIMRGTDGSYARCCFDANSREIRAGVVLLWAGLGDCLLLHHHHYLLNMGRGLVDFGSEAMSARFDTELACFSFFEVNG